jgi:hypothetical protein
MEAVRVLSAVRTLSPAEREALIKLSAGMDAKAREQFLRDIETASVTSATADGSRLTFYLKDYERPKYRGQHAYPVEGQVKDADGSTLTVALYADHNDRLLELELIKYESRAVVRPNWSTFQVKY